VFKGVRGSGQFRCKALVDSLVKVASYIILPCFHVNISISNNVLEKYIKYFNHSYAGPNSI